MSNQIDQAIGSGLFGLATMGLTAGGVGGFANGPGGCWIAERVYGTWDVRTHAVRQWLNTEYVRTKTGRAVMSVYGKIGRQVAPFVRGPIRWLLKPLFDVALRRALA